MSSLFSFPGVPGAQSPPGVPVLPSSAPTKPPSEMIGFGPALEQDHRRSHRICPDLSTRDCRATHSPSDRESLKLRLRQVESFEFRPDVVPDLGVSKRPLDPRLIRHDFPILQERVHGRQLIWLDNAATTQKPNAVIDRLSYFYEHENSNIHRAAHTLAARATDAYEGAREKTRRFLNASSTREIIFVRGTTEGINLVAQSWGRRNVQKDDEIVITWLEHHANIVPWQQLCSEKGARLRVAPGRRSRRSHPRGIREAARPTHPDRLVHPGLERARHRHSGARDGGDGAPPRRHVFCVDGAQAVSHMRVDVQALDCDFYVFSGHKVFGPTGIGASMESSTCSRTCRLGRAAAT